MTAPHLLRERLLDPRQLMILNEFGQQYLDLNLSVRSHPWTSNTITGDCHPLSHSVGLTGGSPSHARRTSSTKLNADCSLSSSKNAR